MSKSYESLLYSNPKYLNIQTQHLEFVKSHREKLQIGERLTPSLTGDTLVGVDKIALRTPTMYFMEDRFFHNCTEDIEDSYTGDNFAVTFFYLGNKLTGHKGVVHGGLLATLLDELTCRIAFLNFESQRGVTANLNIDYKQPTLADQFVMVKCRVLEKKGRKCWVRGEVFKMNDDDSDLKIDKPENLLVSCKVLVVEPKWVEKLT
ncbi:hypothetical protein SBY92_000875 [Candida maltosa Xu316]